MLIFYTFSELHVNHFHTSQHRVVQVVLFLQLLVFPMMVFLILILIKCLKLSNDIVSDDVTAAINSGLVEQNNQDYVCKVCFSTMTGIAPLKSHLRGKSHKKKEETSK